MNVRDQNINWVKFHLTYFLVHVSADMLCVCVRVTVAVYGLFIAPCVFIGSK